MARFDSIQYWFHQKESGCKLQKERVAHTEFLTTH